ncbi:homocysteine S-methyltransferase family protein [Aminicella lysinilytica]|uniref:Methionine synthase n=1 Tax=Aminicella lysinilytica TaxID=433323 RepID=A0A4R6PZA2_9FIRM|nr:homocysteine S-methyltransferase family protein [Aminicella lysinilytica]TDP49872.1 5-methyltetrahydrofolate--homocysteine methyltransferase [Aminicella lysinilytica]
MKLEELFTGEFVYMDGGLGTMLQSRGVDLGKVPEVLNITAPEVIKSIHKEYIDAGSDMICTCSFGVNKYKIEGCGYSVKELIEAAVRNAREAVEGTYTKVALDIGPTGRLMEPNGDLTFDEVYDMFKEQIIAGRDADLIMIETMSDLYEIRAALLAAKENSDLPVICSMTFEDNLRTFTGTCIPSMALTLEGLGADAIGMNCSMGPKEFKPLIEELSKWTTLPIIAKANAGLPDPATGEYLVGPDEFAASAAALIPLGVKFIGGCCGTTPAHIKAIRKVFKKKRYQKNEPVIPTAVCTPEQVVIIDEPRVIGERINPTGKKKLKAAISEGNLEYVLDLAINEVNEGAEILDVNAGVPGVDEKKVIVNIVKTLQGTVTAPLQIDSNNPEVLEAALRAYCGKAIVNSANGEKGSMKAVLPIVKKYGACVIGLTMDEEGIPETVEKRIEIARKIVKSATALGIRKEDIIIDCLTLTVSAEQENAQNTLEAIRMVKNMGLKTVLGVSNISFGLPQRPVINQNFLQMALTCGLDLAIINPGAPGMMQAIEVYKLIMNIDKGAKNFIDKYKDAPDLTAVAAPTKSAVGTVAAPDVKKDLGYFIDNGLETQCRETVTDMLTRMEPLDIVNNELIPILDKAGEEFEKGRIFIPQLILCATTAQVAFDVIKEKLGKNATDGVSKGKILVATVKGDVHDIGKNIVKVILENYGYEIVDMGKDVEPSDIVERVLEDKIKLVGLSALMTTTLPNMAKTISLLHEKAPDCKIMTGGAVLTAAYAEEIGADFYVKDATASANASKKILG